MSDNAFTVIVFFTKISFRSYIRLHSQGFSNCPPRPWNRIDLIYADILGLRQLQRIARKAYPRIRLVGFLNVCCAAFFLDFTSVFALFLCIGVC
jgi:hypothetical protein